MNVNLLVYVVHCQALEGLVMRVQGCWPIQNQTQMRHHLQVNFNDIAVYM